MNSLPPSISLCGIESTGSPRLLLPFPAAERREWLEMLPIHHLSTSHPAFGAWPRGQQSGFSSAASGGSGQGWGVMDVELRKASLGDQ